MRLRILVLFVVMLNYVGISAGYDAPPGIEKNTTLRIYTLRNLFYKLDPEMLPASWQAAGLPALLRLTFALKYANKVSLQ